MYYLAKNWISCHHSLLSFMAQNTGGMKLHCMSGKSVMGERSVVGMHVFSINKQGS